MDRKPFFPGPCNPKYKDINLFDSERESRQIKEFHEIIHDRAIERNNQLAIIKKYKKEKLKFRKFYN
jgi:hypothetical protein